MDEMLEYAERRSGKTLEVARKAYDDLHERAYKLATVLVAGAGSVGAYALGKLAADAQPVTWAPLAAMSLSWFSVAGYLVWRGMVARPMSPGNGSANLYEYYDALLKLGRDEGQALADTRREELQVEQRRIAKYSQGCSARAAAIDTAYKTLVIVSPLTPLTTWVSLRLLGY